MSKLNLNQLHVMGILNVTPDSFSDGGQHVSLDSALQRAKSMQDKGASIIDIGGESTRPGAKEVSSGEELDRVIPIVEYLKSGSDIFISVDTSKPDVMQEAIRAGADMINDVKALQVEGALQVCANADVAICLMHMQGEPRSMQSNPLYTNVVDDVHQFFNKRIAECEKAGIATDRLILDPGFGFGKTLEHNVKLLNELENFTSFKLPILAGISRKSMIGALLDDAPVDQRIYGSLSAAVITAMKGANIIRVHDVKATVDAMKIVNALRNENSITSQL